MGVEVPRVFDFHGEVVDAEGVRWSLSHPSLTGWFREELLAWVADAMEKAEENSVVVLDTDE